MLHNTTQNINFATLTFWSNNWGVLSKELFHKVEINNHETMRDAALKRAQVHYSWDIIASLYLELVLHTNRK
jgi:hypothetical protein